LWFGVHFSLCRSRFDSACSVDGCSQYNNDQPTVSRIVIANLDLLAISIIVIVAVLLCVDSNCFERVALIRFVFVLPAMVFGIVASLYSIDITRFYRFNRQSLDSFNRCFCEID
jgi:hypothetical protein